MLQSSFAMEYNGLILLLIHQWLYIGMDLPLHQVFNIGVVQNFGGKDGLKLGQE